MDHFTSDSHWNHERIIELCNRSYRDAEEMNEKMIIEWNEVVAPNDVVYHLGDVGYFNAEMAKDILGRLNGKIHLLVGNHDPKAIVKLDRWESVSEIKRIKSAGHTFVLSHYPMEYWDRSHWGVRHLHGHMHGALPATNKRCDVGIDVHKRPITTNEVIEYMNKQPEHKFSINFGN